jgi:Amt family ammonium transporter
VAAAAAALSWMAVEWLHRGKPTALGLASGVVAGLVAVTPASGFVSPVGALFIGLAAGAVCYGAVLLKPRLKYDDSLDAFGVHGVGGFLGAVLTGVFASYLLVNNATFGAGPDDLKKWGNVGKLTADAGRSTQVGIQLLAALTAAAYAFLASLVLVKVVDSVWGFSLDAREENEGLDRSEHGEVGFDYGPALDEVPEAVPHEPRPATVPPNGKRHYTVVVEGPAKGELLHAWSEMCQSGSKAPADDFRVVYPLMTTVQGNRFHFRGGDPVLMRETLQRLFQDRLDGSPVHAHVED